MTIKGYTQGYIVQYVVAELDGTVIYSFDDREEAEACACEGQQIVELDGYGYVREITDASDASYLGDAFTDAQNAGQRAPSEVLFDRYRPIRFDDELTPF